MENVETATNWLWWINGAKTLGAFLVAIGVVAEFLGEYVARPHEKVVEDARQEEIANLNHKAEHERLERIKLEAAIQPRSMDGDQLNSMVQALSFYAGQTANITSYAADVEGACSQSKYPQCFALPS